MSKSLLIGVSGTQNPSKDLIARSLAEELGLRSYALYFPIINACANLLGINANRFSNFNDDWNLSALGITKYELMQKMTKLLYALNTHYLTDIVEMEIVDDKRFGNLFSGSIITDICTIDEAQWVKEQGGIVIQIIRIGIIKTRQQVVEEDLQTDVADYILANDGIPEQLERDALSLIPKLREKLAV